METVKLADEVWVAAALLHREHPNRVDFTIEEIVRRVEREALYGRLRPGVYVHVLQHCVANRPPNPGRYRMLFATSDKRRRLFRTGDSFDRRREGGKIVPEADALPPKYRELLEWYRTTYVAREAPAPDRLEDPILALRGIGRHLAGDEHPDDHVRRLREGWE